MSAKTPIRTVFDGSNNATGLAEFQSGEFVALTHGGLGASLSIGSAGQVLKVNSGGSALEFGNVEAVFNIDGMTDGSGITIADGDDFAISDAGTEKKVNASQIKTYVADITLTTAAQTNITSVGTLTSLSVDDITIDGSTISDGGELSVSATGILNLTSAASTGAAIKITPSAGGVLIDSFSLIVLDADNADNGIQYKDGATEMLRIHNSSSDVILHTKVQDKDLIFKGDEGGSDVTALTLDMSEAGAATFNDKIILGANKAIEFGDSGETITGDGTNLTIASSQNLILDAANELKLDSTVGINLLDDGSSYGLLVDASGDFVIKSQQSDKDIIIKGNDGGSTIEAMRIDMSEGGRIGIGTSTPARDLQIAKSTSGGAVRLEVNNESNTGSSHGVISIYSGGTSGGDPYLHFKVDNGEQYSIGIDNDQSDALVFSNGFGVGSNNLLSIATDGSATFTGTVTANGEVLSAGVSAGFAVAMAIAL